MPKIKSASDSRKHIDNELLIKLAALAVPDSARTNRRSMGEILGLEQNSLADLVHATEAADAFIESASAEIRARSKKARSESSELPSLLAGSSLGMIKTILGDESLRQRVSDLEESVQVTICPRTRGRVRIKHMRDRIHEIKLDDARPIDTLYDATLDFLRSEGLTVQRQGRFGITAAGPARLLQELLRVPLSLGAAWRAPVSRSTRLFATRLEKPWANDLFVAPQESLSVSGENIHSGIDDFVFMPPPRSAVAATPPTVNFATLNADALRRSLHAADIGNTGQGVMVALVDSGFFVDHPYFMNNTFDFKAVDTQEDQTGHGTAMAWNILNIAAECRLRGYRFDDPGGAIERAADDGARVISCSWGWPDEQVFPLVELSIRSVIEDDGAVVLFASGNGERYWPASHPSVIAVGGVYAEPGSGSLQASDFASGFMSSTLPTRMVPDICGLCGLAPSGIYLPLPVPPGSELDVSYSGGTYPEKDETTPDDGWVYNSGTSSSTAQVAGIVALLLEHARKTGKHLSPEQVKTCLQRSAIAVMQGRNAFGVAAIGTPNVASGWGLVNAAAALHEVDKL